MKEVKENNVVTWIRKKNLYIPSKLDEDLEHIKNYYQDYGYTNVAFGEPQLTTIRTGKKPRIRITIPIKEGTIHHLGDVTVTGTTVFKPEAFTGNFPVKQEKKTVDVTVKGTEEGKNDVQFGGGYSEGTGFFVQTQFSTRNFLGEGENLGLSFQRGNRQNFYSLSYADPWFMDTPNSLGVSLFNRNTVFPLSVGYQVRSRGGSVAYGYRLHRFDSLSFVYGLEHVRTHEESNVQPDINGNVPISDISDLTYTSSSIGPSYSFDSRDNPFDTTRGGRVNLGLTFSGGPLGGTIHAFRPTLAMTKFFKLSRK